MIVNNVNMQFDALFSRLLSSALHTHTHTPSLRCSRSSVCILDVVRALCARRRVLLSFTARETFRSSRVVFSPVCCCCCVVNRLARHVLATLRESARARARERESPSQRARVRARSPSHRSAAESPENSRNRYVGGWFGWCVCFGGCEAQSSFDVVTVRVCQAKASRRCGACVCVSVSGRGESSAAPGYRRFSTGQGLAHTRASL